MEKEVRGTEYRGGINGLQMLVPGFYSLGGFCKIITIRFTVAYNRT